MPIEVFYNNFTLKNGANYNDVIESFTRDISWGTYDEDLCAVEPFCENIRKYSPEIKSKHIAVEEKSFSLLFNDEAFNLESEGVDHFIATIAGDVLRYSEIEQIEVADMEFTNNYESYFKGPNIGIDRLYNEILAKTLKGIKRPILAYTVKPRMGICVEEYRKIYKEAAKGGVDIIEDDERLIDPVYCPFDERVDAMADIQKSYATVFSVNITGPTHKMLDRLNYSYSKGIRMVKIDVLVTGFDALKIVSDYIRENLNNDVVITCYPDAYRMYRKLSRKFILKMARLCGADVIYTGIPIWARMDVGFTEEKYKDNIGKLEGKLKYHYLLNDPISNFENIKPALPTISNGCDISHAELIQFIYRKEFKEHYKYAFFIGGGISGFPFNLKKTIKEWIACFEYTAKKDLNNYENYCNLCKRTREKIEAKGIRLTNIKKELGK